MIVHLASEVAPFYKRGGLGDVVGTLPKYLSLKEPNVVISFYYKTRMHKDYLFKQDCFEIEIQNVNYTFYYYHYKEDGVDFYFLNMSDEMQFSDMESGEGKTTDEDGEKPYGQNFPFVVYLYFAKAALHLIKLKDMQPGFVFFHDWHVCGGFVYPDLLESLSPNCKTILLIHNYEFQGEIFLDQVHLLEAETCDQLMEVHKIHGMLTFFSLAFKNADYVATVSETYALELLESQVPHCGMQFLDLIKRNKIYALPNGIDEKQWSPNQSPFLDKHYDVSDYKEIKPYWKNRMYKKLSLTEDQEPVVLFMARLTEQKGINLLMNLWKSEAEAMEQIQTILDQGLKLVVYGRPANGVNGIIHKRLSKAMELFPGKFSYVYEYTEKQAHEFLAGADMILCPSLFEPCGLVQMYGLAFGCVPVVRPVGGLKDTVISYTHLPHKCTGFYIPDFEHESLVETLSEAVQVFHRKAEWNSIVERGMKEDFSWKRSMEKYLTFLDMVEEESQVMVD
ncbi:glycogen/starch synthase [Fulvivirga ulvae]|uniref:glycogen/starch synthase n=1 Tax=Fulvivirga ulvae TaxID=2904245 RepID=UPI001F3C0AD5|nr:glycogen/starch synthase [Fulvivirga ulvae]UII33611.1 glycogen/starch synthase [Fulvivirga ulvae]